MARSKSPPQIPDKFDLLLKLAPLCMDLYDLLRTSNDLHDMDPVSALILATVTVGDGEGQRTTARDMAFFLGTPVRTVKIKLKRLALTGIIEADGDRYRYNPPREMTPDEKRRMTIIKRAFDKLRPSLETLKRLDG
jgi:hypothetical protein